MTRRRLPLAADGRALAEALYGRDPAPQGPKNGLFGSEPPEDDPAEGENTAPEAPGRPQGAFSGPTLPDTTPRGGKRILGRFWGVSGAIREGGA